MPLAYSQFAKRRKLSQIRSTFVTHGIISLTSTAQAHHLSASIGGLTGSVKSKIASSIHLFCGTHLVRHSLCMIR